MPQVLRIAAAVAVSAGLYAGTLAVAPAATPLLLLVPLPGLILATRPSSTECGLWFFLTASVVTVAIGSSAAPGFALPFGLPVLALAVGIRRGWPFEGTVLAGVAAWCIGIAALALLAYGDPPAVIATAREQVSHSVELALATYGSLGVSESAVNAMEAERDLLVNGLVEILPALVMLTGGLIVVVNLMMLRTWTGVARDVNLRLWRTPDSLIWALIVTGFAMFFPVDPVGLVARNVFLVLLGCYFCQGLAIVSFYLERLRLPRGIRIAGYVLIALQHIVAAMVLALGVFDLWGNFRRLNAGPADLGLPGDGE
ncbi:MAG TPA: DUF2232 domain-containing protein [Candidatus Acidoferrales bacterium]|nr:DUF2232 domain-containing protein [Candidatus Acidoferrales bacterium]